MNREDINFGFLWEDKKGIVLDAKHPFDEKWDDEYIKFRNYVENASIEEVIWLIIYSYRDNFPRDYWTVVMSKGMISKYIIKKDNYDIIDGRHFIHKEISLYKDYEKTDLMGFSYVFERIFHFNKDLPLKRIVEDAISEKEYVKKQMDNKTTYKLTDSPISSISITDNVFELKINKNKYRRRNY